MAQRIDSRSCTESVPGMIPAVVEYFFKIFSPSCNGLWFTVRVRVSDSVYCVIFTVRLRSIRTVLLSIFCLYVCLSVCPSVCLSVKRVNCDKTKAPSEKSSIMTNRKSPTTFPMSLRLTSYVAPNPQRGPQKRKFDQ